MTVSWAKTSMITLAKMFSNLGHLRLGLVSDIQMTFAFSQLLELQPFITMPKNYVPVSREFHLKSPLKMKWTS